MSFPYLGHGVGLRVPHYQRALQGALEVDWVEVVTENFFGGGGRPRAVLEAVRRERPLVFHGVSLGIGSLEAPEPSYLRRLRTLARDFEPAWISDHACWTRFEGRESHELLPLPYTEEALAVAVEHTQRAQDALGRPLVLENVSSYVRYAASQLSEWEFLAQLASRSGCSLLLDLNNVVVSAFNHGFSPAEYLAGLPADRVVQFHLANHSQYPHHKFDDHRGPVPEAVWSLYESAVARFGQVSSLIEWDEELPSWERLVAERDQAERRARRVLPAGPDRSRPPAPAQPSLASCAKESAPREELAASQRLFFSALTWPLGVSDLAARDPSARRELERRFDAASRADPIARLELYANAYFYRQLDALRESFPRLASLAGEHAFHDLITDYVLERPSRDPDLHRRGAVLPAFLRDHSLGREMPPLVEIAELELALVCALDAPDAERLTRDDLSRLPRAEWPALELRLAPSVKIVRASHDIALVSRLADSGALDRARGICRHDPARPEAARPEAARPEAARPEAAPPETAVSKALIPEAHALLVFRRGHCAQFRTSDPSEALALDQLARGARFDALCEHLAAHGADPATIVGWLDRWLDEELLQTPHDMR